LPNAGEVVSNYNVKFELKELLLKLPLSFEREILALKKEKVLIVLIVLFVKSSISCDIASNKIAGITQVYKKINKMVCIWGLSILF